ncbi:hypothetical protein BDZ97DRAFT_1832284 [Flammula alnicola]|nr:hypothetical protein BDZ97DRAFT_1832284 [Flammula alnicola]
MIHGWLENWPSCEHGSSTGSQRTNGEKECVFNDHMAADFQAINSMSSQSPAFTREAIVVSFSVQVATKNPYRIGEMTLKISGGFYAITHKPCVVKPVDLSESTGLKSGNDEEQPSSKGSVLPWRSVAKSIDSESSQNSRGWNESVESIEVIVNGGWTVKVLAKCWRS